MFVRTMEKIAVDGIMPERALLRLKRAGIALYKVQKPQKNRIVFFVNAKDCQKVFAIYPKVCYNNSVYTPYTAQSLGTFGIGAIVKKAQKRVGFALGALLFAVLTVAADGFVLNVEFSGSAVYRREALALLEEQGIAPFAPYKTGSEDLFCSKMLSLPGVEYCSVKKSGLRVVVELRTAPFQTPQTQTGTMTAKRDGTLLSLTVIRGTALKKQGDTLRVGEPMVGEYFLTQDGEQVRVEIIARAHIACTYEKEFFTQTQEEAFAAAYLEIGLTADDSLTGREILPTENGYTVRLSYTVVQRMNV